MTSLQEAKELLKLAVSKGFKIDDSRVSHHGYRFKREAGKGTITIWSIRDGWQCADLINGRYENHRPYENLKTALETEGSVN